ncbi:sugar ABC transporter substrate-binding protein [Paenibacillus chondroitinus]|uniref:Sugar ABC transporter substrate-binding protein n=1 Tax=Paenibacillus chondroitinus TaxID=59842 RepID=A0ABU6DF49_9BACL|nr:MULTISPECIES: sugar ABC transporter substrate-binding protein [Paenibacillus]MCY9662967.1 sugar ABC transporter substrate-binding protein [Paenibacillus anseongense]MEB4795588.1 sugar ABC transporter substrate-binding protein [Paenibacillus chondroitinus]
MKLKRLKRRSVLTVLLASSLVYASACSTDSGKPIDKGSSESPKAQEGQKAREITIFTRTGPDTSDYVKEQGKEFTKLTGIKVNITEQGASNYFTNMTNQLIGGTDTFDLATTNNTYVAPLAEAGAIEPYDEYIKKFDPNYDWKDVAFQYKYKDKTVAMPYNLSIHLFYYRSDLIPNPPQTWEEFAAEANKWTKSKNPASPTAYGASWTALSGSEQPKVFYSMMWSFGGEIAKDGKAGVGSAGAIKAGELWQSMVKDEVIPKDTPNWGYSNVFDALKTGTIAMAAPFWSAAYTELKKSDSPYKDKIKIGVIPGEKQADGKILRTPLFQSWTLIMNKNAKNKEDAAKFVEFMTSKEGAMREAKLGGLPIRYSVLSDPSLQPREFYDTVLETLKVAKDEPLVPYYLKQHEIMNTALSGIMTGTVKPDAALKSAEKDLQALIDGSKK